MYIQYILTYNSTLNTREGGKSGEKYFLIVVGIGHKKKFIEMICCTHGVDTRATWTVNVNTKLGVGVEHVAMTMLYQYLPYLYHLNTVILRSL